MPGPLLLTPFARLPGAQQNQLVNVSMKTSLVSACTCRAVCSFHTEKKNRATIHTRLMTQLLHAAEMRRPRMAHWADSKLSCRHALKHGRSKCRLLRHLRATVQPRSARKRAKTSKPRCSSSMRRRRWWRAISAKPAACACRDTWCNTCSCSSLSH